MTCSSSACSCGHVCTGWEAGARRAARVGKSFGQAREVCSSQSLQQPPQWHGLFQSSPVHLQPPLQARQPTPAAHKCNHRTAAHLHHVVVALGGHHRLQVLAHKLEAHALQLPRVVLLRQRQRGGHRVNLYFEGGVGGVMWVGGVVWVGGWVLFWAAGARAAVALQAGWLNRVHPAAGSGKVQRGRTSTVSHRRCSQMQRRRMSWKRSAAASRCCAIVTSSLGPWRGGGRGRRWV